jgi:hypothetical protein
MPEGKAHKDSPAKQEEQVIAEAGEGNGGRKLYQENPVKILRPQRKKEGKRVREKVSKRCLAEATRKEEKKRNQVFFFFFFFFFLLYGSFLFSCYWCLFVWENINFIRGCLCSSIIIMELWKWGWVLDPSSLSLLIPKN